MPSKKTASSVSTATATAAAPAASPKVAKKAAPKKAAAKTTTTKAAAKATTTKAAAKTTTTKSAAKTTTTKAAAKKTTTKKAAVAAAPVAAVPVAAAPVAATADETTVVEMSQLQLLEERFNAITEQVNTLRTMSTALAGDLKTLRKDVVRAVKKSGRRKRTPLTAEEKAARPLSGFAKPTIISDELCGFLGKPIGTEVARTEVTKFLSSYIKEHKLQDTVNKKVIHPDAKLKALLNCDESAELTFFTIQKYMKGHFKSSAASSSN